MNNNHPGLAYSLAIDKTHCPNCAAPFTLAVLGADLTIPTLTVPLSGSKGTAVRLSCAYKLCFVCLWRGFFEPDTNGLWQLTHEQHGPAIPPAEG
ncbi:MAG: hypothetical protein Q8R28_12425 [Dehalococcoidia bacterium]|nr:hypothetical protein [Dehalococcoidia bacterium]